MSGNFNWVGAQMYKAQIDRDWRVRRSAAFLSLLCLLAAPAMLPIAFAADGLGNVADRQSPAQRSEGIRAGSFVLRPEVALEVRRDDNVFATDDDVIADEIVVLTTDTVLRSDWNNHAVFVQATTETERFRDNGTEDGTDYVVRAGGRLDITRTYRVEADAETARRRENRRSPEAVASREPLDYDDRAARVTATREVGRVATSVFGQVRDRDYQNSDLTVAGGRNERDRRIDTLGARVTYDASPGRTLFMEARASNVDFDDDVPSDLRRSHDVRALELGAEYTLTDTVSGDVTIGLDAREYEAPELSDSNVVTLRGRMYWNPTGLTTVTASIGREVFETSVNGAAGFESERIGLALDHELRRHVVVSAAVTTGRDEFFDLDREDDVVETRLSARYFFARGSYLSIFHEYSDRDSNGEATGRSYDANVVGLGIGYVR